MLDVIGSVTKQYTERMRQEERAEKGRCLPPSNQTRPATMQLERSLSFTSHRTSGAGAMSRKMLDGVGTAPSPSPRAAATMATTATTTRYAMPKELGKMAYVFDPIAV